MSRCSRALLIAMSGATLLVASGRLNTAEAITCGYNNSWFNSNERARMANIANGTREKSCALPLSAMIADLNRYMPQLKAALAGKCRQERGSAVGRTSQSVADVLQTVSEIKADMAFCAKVNARGSTVGHLRDAEPEADSLMTRARAAERYCNYSSQMMASNNYAAAARVYEKDGRTDLQQQAEAKASRAADNADRCKSRKGGSPPPKPPNSCKPAVQQMQVLSQAGGDVTALAAKLKKFGCQIPEG